MGGTIGRERQDAGAALNQGADLHLREMGANLREVARAVLFTSRTSRRFLLHGLPKFTSVR